MSIKIHDGLRFKISGMQAIHELCERLRRDLAPIVYTKIQRSMVDIAVTAYDRHILGEAAVTSGPMTHGFMAMLDKQHEREKSGESDEMDLLILPDGAAPPLAMLFGPRELVRIALGMAKDELEPYPYWDNFDRPEGMTAEEWAARGEHWARVLRFKDRARPVDCGFMSRLTHVYVDPLLDEVAIADLVPNYEARLRARAAERLYRDIVQRMEGEGGELGSLWSRAYSELLDRKEEIAVFVEQLRSVLPEEVDIATLRGTTPLPPFVPSDEWRALPLSAPSG